MADLITNVSTSTSDTYPLKRTTTTYTGKSPSATTDESTKFKTMLGSNVAGEDVGLFYQLNVVANENNLDSSTASSNKTTLVAIADDGSYA